MILSVIVLSVSLVLLLGFFSLTVAEANAGTRLLPTPRRKLDRLVGRALFIVEHVNWADFFGHLLRSAGARIAHDVAHWSLLIVRFVERQLTRFVRYLRNSRPTVLAPKPSRGTLVDQITGYVERVLQKHL